jgi:flagellar biosynthetic protein FliR
MPINLHIDINALARFVLTLMRVGTALFLMPLAGFKDSVGVVRIVLVVMISICLLPLWPPVSFELWSVGQFILAAAAESSVGLLLGLAVAFLHECFQFAAQAISLQSGFSFASVYDPTSKADSGIFLVITQLTTGLLFFLFDIHHQLLRLLARSFDVFSFGSSTAFEHASITVILHLAGAMFVTGLKLGLPLVVLLLLVELSLALLSRLHAQMQLMAITFPAKTMVAIAVVAAMVTRWPSLYQHLAANTFRAVGELFP